MLERNTDNLVGNMSQLQMWHLWQTATVQGNSDREPVLLNDCNSPKDPTTGHQGCCPTGLGWRGARHHLLENLLERT